MAGKSRFGSLSSSAAIPMTVVSTPSPDLAYMNLVFVNPSDLAQFAVPGSNLYLAAAGHFVFSLSYPFFSI
ncbi:hypothetical protein FRX31_025453 [Thalictrum thalictroides]|uniref:Uncharacterized protein n=1 Tax=Thalictrum thalictroides TaxID=46969 RepID=A0A7J6VJ80_THATH|nr:hypothetical protein FRX31_025453 [Thalictrum thalictroides]